MTTSSERSLEFWFASAAHRRQVSVVADELLPGVNSNLDIICEVRSPTEESSRLLVR